MQCSFGEFFMLSSNLALFSCLGDVPLQASNAPGCELARARRISAPAIAQVVTRVVTTGRKNSKDRSYLVDDLTGERVQTFVTGSGGASFTRFLEPLDSSPRTAALIDALAFSLVPPDERSYAWLLEQMQQFLDIGAVEVRRGLFGFRHSARFGDGAGVIAWGGESQFGKVYFSLMGKGCSMVKDWTALADWLEFHKATIKRADVAYDDFEGKLLNIEWAVQQYQGDGFNAGGRKPSHSCAGDWLGGIESARGRTLYIGTRESGKLGRFYEKGKQLGDGASKWCRAEVEWRAQDRYIPYDILTRPGHYLAGAYPCLAFLCEQQCTIKTVAKGAQVAYETAIENAKRSCGKVVNLILDVLGGDYAGVVKCLIRDGYPGRIDPYSYHVKRNPAMLDRGMQGALA